MHREQGFQIGPWEVRPTRGTIAGPAGTVHLEPKVMDVLVYLAERAGEVVTREQFIERVWHGRIVSDEVLSRCISLLRTQLGDNPREPRYIQTVPKIGYRLVLPVERELAASPSEVEPETTAASEISHGVATPGGVLAARRQRRALIYIGISLVALVLAWSLARLVSNPPWAPADPQTAIVVLPFVNMSNDPGNEYFSDGLTEELIDRLAAVPGLQVVARTSAFSFKGNSEDVRSIAGRLGVGYVLEGSVRKEGEQVRITAQLVDAEEGFHVWSDQFNSDLRNIFSVQDEIANAIVAQLSPRLASGRASAQINTAPPTEVIPAYELALRAAII